MRRKAFSGSKEFGISAVLVGGLLLCTLVAFTVGGRLRTGVKPITAKKDYLVTSMEGKGTVTAAASDGMAEVMVKAGHKLALQLMGNGAEIQGYFLEKLPGSLSVMEEKQYFGKILGWQAKNGKYEIRIGFEDAEAATVGQPVALKVLRHVGPYIVLPESAIVEKPGSSYVYRIVTKDSMWGEDLVAEEIPVTVLEKSEGKAAVSGVNPPDAWGSGDADKIAEDAALLSNGEAIRIVE
ncbi:hypothetical protein NXH76_26780 [Blautia schinkii]|nr:hypothetical protein [Blautia schinkii]